MEEVEVCMGKVAVYNHHCSHRDNRFGTMK